MPCHAMPCHAKCHAMPCTTRIALSIGGNKIRAKQQDKYLGDILSEGGLKASVQATINERYGKSYSAIREIGAVINDFRLNTIGGLRAGLDIFEMVVVPSLLNNSDG